MHTVMRALQRSLLCLAVSAVPAAAQDPVTPAPVAQPASRSVEVDRIVAVVGTHPVLFSEVLERINFARANGLQVPADSAGQIALARQVLNSIVDEQVLIAVAKDYKIEVTDTEVMAGVEQNIERIRAQFQDEAQLRAALVNEGFGNLEAFRRQSIENAKKEQMQALARDSLRANGRLAPVNVTEAEVAAAFERVKEQLPPRPATVAFRQVVVAPQPRPDRKAEARARIDSLRAQLLAGADFDSLARAHSADGSAAQGGDLGWSRRGRMVPVFDEMMFSLVPGRISPVIETQYGFHVMRVDRVRSAEVRARHILIKPLVDSLDGVRARVRADTVLALWTEGVAYDSLVRRFHDPDEERSIPEGYPRDSLPQAYRTALQGVEDGAFTPIFALPDAVTGVPKSVVLQLMGSKPAGEYTLEDQQERLRQQLREEKSLRRTLDNLRREYYVSLRL